MLLYLICNILLKANYLATSIGKILIYRAFIKTDKILLFVDAEFYVIHFQMIFYAVL